MPAQDAPGFRLRQFSLNAHHRRVPAFMEIDADQQVPLLRHLHDKLTFAYRGGERFLPKHMFAVAQGGEDGFGVVRIRCRHRDDINSLLL